MGSLESKINCDERELPTTPTQCIKSSNLKNLSEMDPRSPTDSIIRTPIQVPINLSNQEQIEVCEIAQIEHATDPRSPTDEFPRTPIFIETTVSPQPPRKLHNKILDNARRSNIYTPTLTSKTNRDFQASSFQTPPKLLESSPVSRTNNDNRKSFVGLLETNIDYTETDLDKYVKFKSLVSGLTININENFHTAGNIIKQDNCDPRSPSIEFLRTPIQITEKVGEVDLNNVVNDNIKVDSQETEVDYKNTESLLKIANMEVTHLLDHTEKSITVYNTKEGILQENDIQDNGVDTYDQENFADLKNSEVSLTKDDLSFEEISHIVKNLVDHVETVTLMNSHKIEESPINREHENIKEPVIDLTADVQEFDRKLTKIIYEDEETFSFKRTPKNDKDEKPRNRTPMKDRNVIIDHKKNKLKVSDKPRKSDYMVSKIPVFREKNCDKKVQCENAIPGGLDVRKKRKSHQPKWDSDQTLVI